LKKAAAAAPKPKPEPEQYAPMPEAGAGSSAHSAVAAAPKPVKKPVADLQDVMRFLYDGEQVDIGAGTVDINEYIRSMKPFPFNARMARPGHESDGLTLFWLVVKRALFEKNDDLLDHALANWPSDKSEMPSLSGYPKQGVFQSVTVMWMAADLAARGDEPLLDHLLNHWDDFPRRPKVFARQPDQEVETDHFRTRFPHVRGWSRSGYDYAFSLLSYCGYFKFARLLEAKRLTDSMDSVYREDLARVVGAEDWNGSGVFKSAVFPSGQTVQGLMKALYDSLAPAMDRCAFGFSPSLLLMLSRHPHHRH
jgi:hypothetical protein